MRTAAAALLAVVGPVLAVWPQPAQMTVGNAAVRLAPSFTIKVAVSNAPQDLVAAVARTEFNLGNDRHRRLVVGRGKDNQSAISSAPQMQHLNIQLVAQQPVRPIAEESTLALEDRVGSISTRAASKHANACTERRVHARDPGRRSRRLNHCKYHSWSVSRIDDVRATLLHPRCRCVHAGSPYFHPRRSCFRAYSSAYTSVSIY